MYMYMYMNIHVEIYKLIITYTCTLMCVYPQEVIAFQQDQSPDVRKFVVQFMEDAW